MQQGRDKKCLGKKTVNIIISRIGSLTLLIVSSKICITLQISPQDCGQVIIIFSKFNRWTSMSGLLESPVKKRDLENYSGCKAIPNKLNTMQLLLLQMISLE